MPLLRCVLSLAMTLAAIKSVAADPAPEIRVGMIGLDTSHVPAFAKILNAENPEPSFQGVRIVAAFPAGSPDFPASRDRVAGFTEQIRGMGIEIVSSIDELLPKVDAVLLMSVDGRVHLEQAAPVLAAKKPVFIDKPVAADLADTLAIYDLAEKHGTPVFSSSSSRFSPGYPELRRSDKVGEIRGADAYSASTLALGHPDLFFYGIHGAELLYTMMGTGCERVTALQTPLAEHVTGIWAGGRVGTYRGIREDAGATGVGVTVYGTKGIVTCDNTYDYKPLVAEITTFFRTGKPPVSPEETVELVAFLAAAERSKSDDGRSVPIVEVMDEARHRMVQRIEAVSK